MQIGYELLKDENDTDIEKLKFYHQIDEIKKYINIADNYFNFVALDKNVFYYKIKLNKEIVGALHLEKNNKTIYLSIWIKPDKQHWGIATKALQDLISNKFNIEFNNIIVSIEETNYISIKLFEKLGFKKIKKENELILYEFSK